MQRRQVDMHAVHKEDVFVLCVHSWLAHAIMG